MNTETFNKLLDELDGNSLETLKRKSLKYATDGDLLHNFESGAEIMGSTPAQCAWGYLTKHLVALRDKVERDDFSDREDFLEKCQDIINYIRFIWVIGNDTQPIIGDRFCGWDYSDYTEEENSKTFRCWIDGKDFGVDHICTVESCKHRYHCPSIYMTALEYEDYIRKQRLERMERQE